MSLFDFISKPIKSANPLTMLPKPDVSPLPQATSTPIVKPATPPAQFITKPISQIISEGRAGITDAANKTAAMKIPEPTTKVDVDWTDVANMVPILIGQLASPAVSGLLSIAEAARENINKRTGLNLPSVPQEFTIPAFGRDKVKETFGKTGGSYQKLDRGNFLDVKTTQKAYEEDIASGTDPDKAFWNATLKTVGDMSVLVPFMQGLSKTALLRTAPEKLINPEVLTADRQMIRDFITGRRTSIDLDIPQPLKEAITETLKNGSRAEKIKMLGGIDILEAKPSQLGKMLGISQEEANVILQSAYGGPIRPTPTAALPGYTTEQPVLKMGLSTEKKIPVGYGDEIPPELKPLAEEAKKYKSAEEFVKAQGDTYYHGTDASIRNEGLKPSSIGVLGDGVYLTPDIKTAGQYGKNILEAKVSNAKLLSLGSKEAEAIAQEAGTYVFPVEAKFEAALRKAGYDGLIDSKGNVSIKNPKVLKTKSQLTDLYNKATANLPAVGEAKQSKLDIARKAMAKAETKTGVQPVDNVDIEQANLELTQQLEKESLKGAKEVANILEVKKGKTHIDSLRMENIISKEMLLEDPARQLSKYANKRTGELPEVTGNPTSVFAQKGDDIVTELGFKDSEEARAAYEAYVERRKRVLNASKNLSEITKEYRDRKEILDAVTKRLRAVGVGRKIRIDSIKEFFNLTDAEMAKVVKGNPDYRLISEEKFQQLLKDIEAKAYDAFKLSEARAKVEFTIFDKELLKTDNLIQAMKLPDIKDMTIAQLEELDALLKTFKTGDEFLGVRQLETIKNTDIANVKTKREVLEDLAKRTGVPYLELGNIKIGKFDRYLYDVALARQSPFHRIMVEDTSKALANANVRLHQFKTEFNDLMMRARKSRSRSTLDRAIPTDDMIFDWLDSDSSTKVELAKRMTAEELDVARFVYSKYAEVRDYLVNKGQLDRYRTAYITHIQRGFLEVFKENIQPKYVNGRKIPTSNIIKRAKRGVFEGLKEMISEYKQQEEYFNIMNQKTGEVLPLEKFFRYSLKRTDQLVPTKNVSRAVLQYMSAFEKKAALDSIVPKIDVYAHSITPNGMTPRGLELDDSIKRFVKEWLNTKRGRVADVVLVTPGGPIDWAIRTLISFTRMIDLGINVPVGLASNVGEQVMTAVNIGFQKTGLGIARSLTPQGKKIAEKYSGFVGERMIDKIRDTSKDIGDKFSETIFGLFSAASRRANIEHLLGSMTKEEFAKGEISPERLGAMRLEIGRYRTIEQGESVIGKTAIGKAFTQYKSWAVGTVHSTLSNLNTMRRMIAQGTNPATSKEFQELFRATIMLSFIAVTSYGAYSRLRDNKERTFLEQLAFKSMNDSFTMIGALSPSLWTSPARVLSFIENLGKSITDMAVSLATGERTKQDKNIKGLSSFINTFTPSVVRTVQKMELDELFKDIMSNKPNKLKGIKLTPRANKLDELKKTNTSSKLKGIKLVPKKNKTIELK